MQLSVNPDRGFELEGAGAGDGRARDTVARQEVAGMPGLVGRLGDRLAALLPAAQMPLHQSPQVTLADFGNSVSTTNLGASLWPRPSPGGIETEMGEHFVAKFGQIRIPSVAGIRQGVDDLGLDLRGALA